MIAVAIAVIAGVVAVTCGIVADSNHADTLTFLGVMVKTTAAQIFLAGAICTWALFAALWLLSLGVRRSRERGIELRDLRAAQTSNAYRAISAAGLGLGVVDVDSTDADSQLDRDRGRDCGRNNDRSSDRNDDGNSDRDTDLNSDRNFAGIAGIDPESPFSDFDAISTSIDADTGAGTGTGTQAAFAPESVTPAKELTPPPPKLTLLPTLTPPTLQPPNADRTFRG